MEVPPFQRRRTVASVGTTRCTPAAVNVTVTVRHVLLADDDVTTLVVGLYELYSDTRCCNCQHTGCNVEELEL